MASSSFVIHADILKMAKAQEHRKAIKWFHARRIFFEKEMNFAEGLELRVSASTQMRVSWCRCFQGMHPSSARRRLLCS